jgi:hypothetical protein
MFLGVQLRGVAGQAMKPDVLRNTQVLRYVGTCPIEDHDNEVPWMGSTDLFEKIIHPVGVHVFTNHPVQFTLKWADGPVHIDELPLVTVTNGRPNWHWCPAASQPYHPAKSCFVLEDQADRSVFDIGLVQDGRQRLGKFFLHSSCNWGSLFGCRVSGAIFRQPCRARNRYTTEAATGRPSLCDKAARMGDTTNTPPVLACSAHGLMKSRSSSILRRARRRPPQEDLCGTAPSPRRFLNRVWRRCTVARLTPSVCPVCSRVTSRSAGNEIANACLYSSRLTVWRATWCACITSFISIRFGLAIPSL